MLFLANRRHGSMARVNDGGVVQLRDFFERLFHRRGIRIRQIGSANRAGEQEITAERHGAVPKDDMARRVAGV
jgi:hypothetical protein